MKTLTKAVLMVLPLVLVAVALMASAPRQSANPVASPTAVAVARTYSCPTECFTSEQGIPSDLGQAVGGKTQVAMAR